MGTITLEKLIDFMKKNIYNRSMKKFEIDSFGGVVI